MKTRTALLTPLQVREAIFEWAWVNGMFPAACDPDQMASAKLTIKKDGSASIVTEKEDGK